MSSNRRFTQMGLPWGQEFEQEAEFDCLTGSCCFQALCDGYLNRAFASGAQICLLDSKFVHRATILFNGANNSLVLTILSFTQLSSLLLNKFFAR